MGKGIYNNKLTLIVALLVVFSASYVDASFRELELFDQGYEYYLSYQPEKAVKTLNVFLKEFPNSSIADAAMFWLGKSLIQMKAFDDAQKVFSEVKQKFPDSPFLPQIGKEMQMISTGTTGTKDTKVENLETKTESTVKAKTKSDSDERIAKTEKPSPDAENMLSKKNEEAEKLRLQIEEEKKKIKELQLKTANLEKMAIEQKDKAVLTETKTTIDKQLAKTGEKGTDAEKELSKIFEETEKLRLQLEEEQRKNKELKAKISDAEKKAEEIKKIEDTARLKSELDKRLAEIEKKAQYAEKDLSKSIEEKRNLWLLLEEEKRVTKDLKLQIENRAPDTKDLSDHERLKRAINERLAEIEKKTQSAEKDLTRSIEERGKVRMLVEEERKKTKEVKDKLDELEKKEFELKKLHETTKIKLPSMQQQSAETKDIADDGTTISLNGRLMKIYQEQKAIVVKDDNSGENIVIYFEDERLFNRINKLQIEIGYKILVKYTVKNKRNIGKYIRSLSFC